MSDPYTKPEIIERLRDIQHEVAVIVAAIPPARFDAGSAESWSPAGYLKHLLLSVKPFAKAVTFPPDALKRRFGSPDRPMLPYAELCARYQARLDGGIRAEDYEAILPTAFRMPDDAANVQAYLIDLWNEAHDRMIGGLDVWTEAHLDGVAILHPAIGTISVREMLFFTIFHNTLHWNDIRAAAGIEQL
ncbi:MAG: DinB family protein [Anaerolineae bacterium]|nr:DinB family protein [Anaerolineae bacterium]